MSNANYQKLLIVDNNLVAAKEIETYFKNIGFNILGVTTSHNETMQFLQTNSVDMLLMEIDINGNVDGIQSCDIIYYKYKIPSIFVTSHYNDEVLSMVESSYAYGYLLRPFQYGELRMMVRLILSKLKSQNTLKNVSKVYLQNEFSFCMQKSILYCRNIEVNLTPLEKKFIYILSKHKDSNLSYEFIFEYVWNNQVFCINKLRGSVFRIKKKIPCLMISNNQDIGYKIE